MSFLLWVWHRWFDRTLDRPVALPDRDSTEPGEWNAFVGSCGEDLAARHLRRTWRKVLYRNYRPEGGGEIDVVYRDGNTLVFGEVKTRTRGDFGEPAKAVDRAKEKLVIRGANAWLDELNHPEILFRFDIVEVILRPGKKPSIRVVENAFTTPQRGLGL